MEKRHLTTAILLSLAFTLFLPLISSFEWTQYSSGFALGDRATQKSNVGSILTSSYSNTMAQGLTVGSDPILANPLLNESLSEQVYLFIQNGNYLQVYNSNLVLVTEFLTGTAKGHLAVYDLNKDSVDEVVNVYQNNATEYSFRSYYFDTDIGSFVSSSSYNFTVNSGDVVAGVRCSVNCYFLTSQNPNNAVLYVVNSSSLFSTTLVGLNKTYTEHPLIEITSGTTYLLTSTSQTTSSGQVILIKEDGSLEWKKDYTRYIYDIKFFHPDAGSFKVAVATFEDYPYGGQYLPFIDTYKSDGSTYLSRYSATTGFGSFVSGGVEMAVADYDDDNFDDLFYYSSNRFGASTQVNVHRILKGTTLSTLMNYGYSQTCGSCDSLTPISLADMNGDGYVDIIESYQVIYSNGTSGYNRTLTNAGSGSCVPADFQFNGKLDIVCSSSGSTKVIYSNYTNNAPNITSVSYDPALTINKDSTLNVLISAYDVEGNSLTYEIRCSDDGEWIEGDSSLSCYYSSVGYYNVTVGVRDLYHPFGSFFSRTVTVTSGGTVCGNDICETGETVASCPLDCSTTPSQTQSSVNGSIVLPTQIVDVNNPETGLLPEVYYGTLGFLSSTLQPMMILIFGLFFVMIVLAIGFIIKGFAGKVGNLMS